MGVQCGHHHSWTQWTQCQLHEPTCPLHGPASPAQSLWLGCHSTSWLCPGHYCSASWFWQHCSTSRCLLFPSMKSTGFMSFCSDFMIFCLFVMQCAFVFVLSPPLSCNWLGSQKISYLLRAHHLPHVYTKIMNCMNCWAVSFCRSSKKVFLWRTYTLEGKKLLQSSLKLFSL